MAEDIKPVTELKSERPLSMLERIRKSKFKFLLIISIACLVFTPFASVDLCLSGAILSVALIILFWLFQENNIWHQLGIGVVAFCLAALIMSAIFIGYLTTEPDEQLQSIESTTNPKLSNGHVAPFRGNEDTLFNYTISVRANSNSANISAHVIIVEDVFFTYGTERNETMHSYSSYSPDNSSWVFNFSYTTHLTKMINSYMFNVSVDGIWYQAGIPTEGGIQFGYGPVTSDTMAIFGNVAQAFTMYLFVYSFMPFLILVLFYRFSIKSKDARTKMLEEYKRLKAEKAGQPLLEKPKEETFVCSECGAEVQASAKFCPNCGEPFEEEESPEPKTSQSKEAKKD
ncbi:MAG: zinc ribbon domain-containing protein [Thermoplasmata archaeon]